MQDKKEQIILGIDPGTSVMGYGVIKIVGSRITLLSLGVIKLKQYESHQKRLQMIFERVTQLLKQYLPDICAIEAPFYGKNVQSMLKLGRAQGVCIAATMMRDVPIVEYAPKKIKQSITGNGNASKEQVAAMLQKLCNFKEMPKYLDATDGLSVAVCHYFQSKSPITAGGGFKSWADFAKKKGL